MKLTKKFLIDSIVSLENLIAEIKDVPVTEFMRSVQGLEKMSIHSLKVRLRFRSETGEKYLTEKGIKHA